MAADDSVLVELRFNTHQPGFLWCLWLHRYWLGCVCLLFCGLPFALPWSVAAGIILCFDVTNRKSYANMRKWIREIVNADKHKSIEEKYIYSSGGDLPGITASGWLHLIMMHTRTV